MKERIELLSKMLKSGYSIDQVKRECWQYCLSQSIGSATLESAILSAMSMFAEIMARNLPVLDGSETTMDEARGRNAELKWNEGAPETPGSYLLRFNTFSEGGIDIFFNSWDEDDILFRSRRVLAHIGPIPPPPQNDEQ